MKILNEIPKMISAVVAGAILLSSCATIVGGSKYYAHVTVNNHPNASISYNGFNQGKGFAAFKVPRVEANAFSVTVKEENCEAQTFNYTQRSFRGWAFVGTIFTWTGVYQGIPLPWGIAVDAASGSLWKPDITERGVSKIDYKHFSYLIEYTGCRNIESNLNTITTIKTKYERLKELQDLLDKGTLTQEEFDKEKKKLLDEQN